MTKRNSKIAPFSDKTASKGPSKNGIGNAGPSKRPHFHIACVEHAVTPGHSWLFALRICDNGAGYADAMTRAHKHVQSFADAIERAARAEVAADLNRLLAERDDARRRESDLFREAAGLRAELREANDRIEWQAHTLDQHARELTHKRNRCTALAEKCARYQTALDAAACRIAEHLTTATNQSVDILDQFDEVGRAQEAERTAKAKAEDAATAERAARNDAAFAKAAGKTEGRAQIAQTLGTVAASVFGAPAEEVAAAVLTATAAIEEGKL